MNRRNYELLCKKLASSVVQQHKTIAITTTTSPTYNGSYHFIRKILKAHASKLSDTIQEQQQRAALPVNVRLKNVRRNIRKKNTQRAEMLESDNTLACKLNALYIARKFTGAASPTHISRSRSRNGTAQYYIFVC